MFSLCKSRLLDLLGSTHHSSKFGLHLAHSPEAALAYLLDYSVFLEVVFLFHLDEAVPFDLDLLDHTFLLSDFLLFLFILGKGTVQVWFRRLVSTLFLFHPFVGTTFFIDVGQFWF
jgi:hypothetical protein